MSTRTATPSAVTSTISTAPTSPEAATLGACLAPGSRRVRGLDPAVLASEYGPQAVTRHRVGM